MACNNKSNKEPFSVNKGTIERPLYKEVEEMLMNPEDLKTTQEDHYDKKSNKGEGNKEQNI
jgi:hypothetical protein